MPWGYHTLGVELAQPPEQSRRGQCGRWSGQAGRKASPVRPSAGLMLSEALARPTGLSTLPVSMFVFQGFVFISVLCFF